MIENERLAKYFKHYISEVLGMQGQSDIKYKGHFTRIFPVPPAMADWITSGNPNPEINLQTNRLEIETCFASSVHMYRIRTRYIWNHIAHVSEFMITGEVFSYNALQYHFDELHKEFKEKGLIRLTPEEEEAEAKKLAKKQMMATMYGANAGEFDMALLKKELNNVKTPTWLAQGPDGNLHTTNPDNSQKVLHNIMAQVDAMTNQQLNVGMSTFNQLKKLAEEHFQKTGEFPKPDSFIGIGMKVVVDPSVPDGVVVMHTTQPPLQQLPKKGAPKPVPKQVQSYGNSGDILAQVVPALQHRGIPCPEPATCHGFTSNSTLSDLIIHLNDFHKWPRSGTDPNPLNKPNIADWIDEVCLIHGLDQSFHPQEEKKPSPRDWASLKKLKNKKQQFPKLEG